MKLSVTMSFKDNKGSEFTLNETKFTKILFSTTKTKICTFSMSHLLFRILLVIVNILFNFLDFLLFPFSLFAACVKRNDQQRRNF